MRRIIKFMFVFVFIFFFVAIGYYTSLPKTQTPQEVDSDSPTQRRGGFLGLFGGGDESETFVVPKSVPEEIIGKAQKQTVDGNPIFVSRKEYEIMYLKSQDQILISIIEAPFFEQKEKAEQEFLSALDISEEEACNLNVIVTTPRFANPQEAGQEFGLSFCEQ